MAPLRRRPRLVYVVTAAVTADVLLRGQLAWMREQGFAVSVVSAPGSLLDRVGAREGVDVHTVEMQRDINTARDAMSLAALVQLFRRVKPDIVNASTAKAGMLGMLAARAASVPVRIYLLRGLRLETTAGSVKRILGITERVASGCAHEVVCVSESLRRAYVAGGYAGRAKVTVLGKGSSNGIDALRFLPDDAIASRARTFRSELGIPAEAPVIGFVGRLVRDKGIVELVAAFESIRAAVPQARLLVVGAGFAGDQPDDELARLVHGRPGVAVVGKVEDVAPYYAAMDVLAFPSHREGFPNVPLEAAVAGLPVVGTRATGVVDAVVDGLTGTLLPVGDPRGLASGLLRYLQDRALARAHGEAGRRRALQEFDQAIVWRNWKDLYERSISESRTLRGADLPDDVRMQRRSNAKGFSPRDAGCLTSR